MNQISDRNILDKFCSDFCSVIEKHCEYIIVSGFVAIACGRTRGTEDIDMIIKRISKDKFNSLFEDLKKKGFSCIQSDNPDTLFEYLEENTSIRFIENEAFLPHMEVKFVKDKLDEYQFKTKKKIPITGLDIWFSSIEMNIAFKEELLKSEKDIKDAEHLRVVFEKEIDEHEIDNIKGLIKRFRL